VIQVNTDQIIADGAYRSAEADEAVPPEGHGRTERGLMRRLVFDIETDGLDDATTVHSLCIKDIDTGEKWSCFAEPHPATNASRDGFAEPAREADWLGGHNILTYDLPTLKRLRGFEPKPGCLIRDTLVCTRLIWTDLQNEDFRRRDRGGFPSRRR
jgi:DNA polymerase-1